MRLAATSEAYDAAKPLAVVWNLLWDRHYGPRIQRRLKNGGVLDFDFCIEIKREAVAELRSLEAR